MLMLIDCCQMVGDCSNHTKQVYNQLPVQKFAFALGIILVAGAILAQFLSGGAVPLYGVGILGGTGGLMIAAALLFNCCKKKNKSSADERVLNALPASANIKNPGRLDEKEGGIPLQLIEAIKAFNHQNLKRLLVDNELKGEKNSEGNTLFHILLGLDTGSKVRDVRSCVQVLADAGLDINALNLANQTPLDIFNANTSFNDLDREFTAEFLKKLGAISHADLL